jgi:hypothetical protein
MPGVVYPRPRLARREISDKEGWPCLVGRRVNCDGVGRLRAAVLSKKLRQKQCTLSAARDAIQTDAATERRKLQPHGGQSRLRALQRDIVDVGMHEPAGIERVVVAEGGETVRGKQNARGIVPARPASLAAVQADDAAPRLTGRQVEVLTGRDDGLTNRKVA